MCLQVGRRPLQPLAHPLSSVAARLRLERRRRRHPPTRQLHLSGRRLLLRPLGRRRLHLRPSRRRRRLHLRPSERRRLLLRPLGWRRLQLHLSGQRRLVLLSVRQVWAAQLARGAKKNLSHRVCGRGRFDGTGLRCSIRTRWRPSIWFYFRTWRRACVWGCTVSIGVWHTLPTRRNTSFRYVRVSAHMYSSPRAHDSACPFVHRWQRCFRRRPRRWCFCRPFRWWRWVCELRSSSGKRWIWGFGAGRRFCTCAVVWGASLRPVNGQWSSAGVSAAACCGRADVRLSGIGTLVHGGRLHPVSQQYKRICRRARGSTRAIATLHGLLSGLVSMHSTQPRLYLR